MRRTTGMGMGLLLLTATGSVRASDPYLAQYNRDRAYRHFLSSRSPYKTFSTGAGGITQIETGPFSYRRFSSTGTYEEQRIHSRGFERYRILPGYEIEESSPYHYRFVQAPPVEDYQFVPRRPDVQFREFRR